MEKTPIDLTLERLQQFVDYVRKADEHTFWDRLSDFRFFCENTPALASSLAQLPLSPYDWDKQWHQVVWPWGEEENCAFRWDAIKQLTGNREKQTFHNRLLRIHSRVPVACERIVQEFVVFVSEYLGYQLRGSSAMLYLLLRYKCWAEWFGYERLRDIYSQIRNGQIEAPFDEDVRRFLFESGVDYPFMQPGVPGGRVDIAARLETDDPLVLEIKVWDSARSYKENKLCDGLRQVRHYTEKYNKHTGYVVVFNFDQVSLELEGDTGNGPAQITRGGKVYCFIDVHIPEGQEPVSQRDRGKRVKGHLVRLTDLWDEVEK